MKKAVLVVLLIISSLFLFLSGCSGSSNDSDEQEYMETYYGCPNSKRVKKLNLRKHR